MRTTKALLCAAAVAAGAISAMAQSNVYSLNVVGYVNLTLTNGYNMIANQMDFDGNATNNTIYTTIGTNLPTGTQVLTWDAPSSSYKSTTLLASGSWTAAGLTYVNPALNPGRGVFVKIPATASYPQTVTLVGNVLQGTNVHAVAAGYNQVSSVAPVSPGLTTALGYSLPAVGDQTITWDVNAAAYRTKTFLASGVWSGGELVPAVGQSFFLKAKAATNWVQSFNVQ